MKIFINTLVAALIIALVNELSRRFSFLAALLISLPVTSIIALSFMYVETKDLAKVASLSMSIFWLVLPSLGFFILLPVLLRAGLNFWLALTLSSAALAATYLLYSWLLAKFGIVL
jgi:uncharacterized membrane protein (GlpM family)